jgi:hypothetical protein
MNSQTEPKKGLAVASLILGILSVTCLGILAGIPAVITGHMARGRTRRQPDQFAGAGMALAGVIMGYLGVLVTVVLLIVAVRTFPDLARLRGQAQDIRCINQLKQVGLALRVYANDHNDALPPDFLSITTELGSPDVLLCPEDHTRQANRNQHPGWDTNNYSYEFLVPGGKAANLVSEVVVRCPVHGHILLGDGAVQRGRSPRRGR